MEFGKCIVYANFILTSESQRVSDSNAANQNIYQRKEYDNEKSVSINKETVQSIQRNVAVTMK